MDRDDHGAVGWLMHRGADRVRSGIRRVHMTRAGQLLVSASLSTVMAKEQREDAGL
jgi:hypothetical protein